jgi:hypothetical protein
MKLSELIKQMEESISKIQPEYDDMREDVKNSKRPGNPYTASLGTRLAVEKAILEKLKQVISLE